MDQNERVALLATVPILAVLDEEALDELAKSATVRRYRRGQIVFTEGDSGDSLLVVVEGQLKASATSREGDELLLAVIGPGQSVGEVCLADGGTRSATVEAHTSAVVMRIPRESVMSVAVGAPEFTAVLLTAMAAVVRRLTGAAADLVFLDLPRRVAKLLLERHQATGQDLVSLSMSQADVAHIVGASRQSVNAALGNFQRRGWISMEGQTILIRDPAAMTRFVEE
jgi:CRP/FNR family cyclic AMP-dependent transcriptional regulator